MPRHLPLRNIHWRSFCEVCGEPPAHACELTTRTIDGSERWLTLCWDCWEKAHRERPAGVSLSAQLESLWRTRRHAPNR